LRQTAAQYVPEAIRAGQSAERRGTKAGGGDYLLNFVVPRVVTENIMRHGFAPEETPLYRDEFLWPKH
jgi:hypothetical protein